jgi:hypothetical protein
VVNGRQQIEDAIASVRGLAANAPFGLLVSVETVCVAAELALSMMDSPAVVEWCDRHGRPYEFCQVIDAASCDPKRRTVGPEVALWKP